jgi:hypothetical protein
MTSPLCLVQTTCPEKEVALAQVLLCALVPGLTLAQAAGAMTTIMWLMMIASQGHSQSMGICNPPRVMTADVSIAPTRAILFLLPSLLQWSTKERAPTNRKLRQQKICVSHHISLFQVGN